MYTLIQGQLLQYYSAFAATFAIFSYGVQHGWTTPAIAKLTSNESTIQITETESSWLASIEMITFAVTGATAVNISKYFSSKTIIIFQVIPSIISWLLIAFGTNIYYFYVSRIITGFLDVFDFLCVPIYLSEIAQPNIRGRVLCFMPLMYFIGSIYSYYYGYLLSIQTFALVSLSIPIINLLLMVNLPQSPYYLIFQNRFDEGKQVLQQLRGKQDVDIEFEIMKSSLDEQKSQDISWHTFFTDPLNQRALVIVIIVTTIQQVAGGQTISSFMYLIIQKTDLDIDLDVSVTFFAIIQVITTVLTIFIIDKIGRRKLVLLSCVGVIISLIPLGLYFYLKNNGVSIYWIPLPSLYLYSFFYTLGLADISFILSSELFPTYIKVYGATLGSITFGLVGFIANRLYQPMVNLVGLHFVFWFFCGGTILGLVYMYLYLPETNGKSLSEIQEMFDKKTSKKTVINTTQIYMVNT